MADTPKHSVSVAGIVVDDHHRILAIQRQDNGRWEPPGGVLELHETPEAGAAREVLEETGIKVSVDRLTGVYKNMTRGIIALVFRCTAVGGAEALSDETRAVRWMSLQEVADGMSPAYAVRVTDALRDGSVVRSHDGTNLIDLQLDGQ